MLLAPGPVLAQAELGVGSIVELDLRDCRLDQRPDPPVASQLAWQSRRVHLRRVHCVPAESRNASKQIYLIKEMLDGSLLGARLA